MPVPYVPTIPRVLKVPEIMSMAYKVNIESCDNNGTRLGQHGDVELGFLTQHSASTIIKR